MIIKLAKFLRKLIPESGRCITERAIGGRTRVATIEMGLNKDKII